MRYSIDLRTKTEASRWFNLGKARSPGNFYEHFGIWYALSLMTMKKDFHLFMLMRAVLEAKRPVPRVCPPGRSCSMRSGFQQDDSGGFHSIWTSCNADCFIFSRR